ncbi:MAG TPA: DUF1572 domain-containing protein [Bacteroidia bacterium]|nr:DUF1572 domain-containing protein [Bacteroidia bacterium]
MQSAYLSDIKKIFLNYKTMGEKTFAQLNDEHITWQYNAESNGIATIVKHMWGNMLSRWTDFLTTDGEKPSRQRDAEFINDITTKAAMLEKWEEGWACLFSTLDSLSPADLERTIHIRGEAHTVTEAINRQLAHYPYHIGQIVYIAKMIKDAEWQTLSIARNKSAEFNAEKFPH